MNQQNDTLSSKLFEITCKIIDICIFKSWGLLSADQLFSCPLNLLKLYRTLRQLILQQLRKDSRRKKKVINYDDS